MPSLLGITPKIAEWQNALTVNGRDSVSMIKKTRTLIVGSSLAVLLLIAVFYRYWCVTVGSLLPSFLALLSLALVFSFRRTAPREEQTAYGNDLTSEEKGLLGKYTSFGFAFLTPWHGIFLFFFPTAVKFFSVLLLLASFIVGPCLFRIRHGKELQSRFDLEKRELEEQRKREEQGKWK